MDLVTNQVPQELLVKEDAGLVESDNLLEGDMARWSNGDALSIMAWAVFE
jgi:hypothetical protein